ncbi:unnamed protein product [Diplocarpon coronariae]
MANAHEDQIGLAISDTRESTSLAMSDHAQEPSTSPEPSESRLSPKDEDLTDSRTHMVGRKRNLESLRDTGAYEVHGRERSCKRVKDHRDLPTAVEGSSAVLSSSSRVLALTEPESATSQEPSLPLVENLSTYQVPREERQSKATGPDSSRLFSLVGTDIQPNRAQDTVARSAPVTALQGFRPAAVTRTWNAGVSSGLRTSFGNKTQVSASNISRESVIGGRTVNFADYYNAGQLASTSEKLSQDPRSFEPFQKPSKEETSLSNEEKGHYLKELSAHYSEPTRPEAAPAVRVEVQTSDNEDESPGKGMALPVNSHPVPVAGSRYFKYTKPTILETFSPIELAKYVSDLRASLHEQTDERAQNNLKMLIAKAERAAASLHEPNHPSHVPADTRIKSDVSSPDTEYAPSDGVGVNDYDDQNHHQRFKLRRRADEGFLDQNAAAPFVRLASKDVKDLTHDERQKYSQVMHEDKKLHGNLKKLYEFQQATQEAEKAIASGFPLSKDQQKIEDAMSQGRTFYPRRPNRPARYTKGHRNWTLLEAFDMNGKPFKLQDFTFNDFAPIFLRTFPDDWDSMKPKILIGAHATYVNAFYSHLSSVKAFGTVLADAQATATSPDAITVVQAKEIARRQMSNVQNSPQASLSANNSSSNVPSRSPTENRKVVEVLVAPATISAPLASNQPARALTAVESYDEPDITMVEMDAAHNKPDCVNIHLSEVELFLQQRYYPSSDPATRRCLACSKTGHVSLTCPDMKCTACGSKGIHSHSTCPFRKRCSKCREPGHNKNVCPEKLSLPRSEMSCDLCGSTDHLEISCHLVWRSFDPRPEQILKVREIQIHCYSCGSGDHLGPECGLHRGPLRSSNLTWSRANLLKYIDPSSQVRALSAGKDYSIPPRARSGGTNDPITFDESDDEAFIRPPVQLRNAGGNIQVKQTRLKKPNKAETEGIAPASTTKAGKGKGKKPAKTMAANMLLEQKKKAKRVRRQNEKSRHEAQANASSAGGGQ